MDDLTFMQAAIEEARAGLKEGGIPIGAALVADGAIAGLGHNRRVQEGSAIKHGETDALENAGRLPAAIYRRATMYSEGVEVVNLDLDECRGMMAEFIAAHPDLWNEDIGEEG